VLLAFGLEARGLTWAAGRLHVTRDRRRRRATAAVVLAIGLTVPAVVIDYAIVLTLAKLDCPTGSTSCPE